MLRFDVHDANATHEAFLFSSFLHGMRDCVNCALLPNGVFYPFFHEAFKQKLADVGAVIAVSADDADTLLGWAMGTPNKLEYVYVKNLFRRQGVAKRLVSEVLTPGPKCSKMEHAGIVEIGFIGPSLSLIVAMLAKANLACAVEIANTGTLLSLLTSPKSSKE